MNIRIGNDIRLNLTINGISNYNRTNIKQLRCYFVNTSYRDFKPEPCAIKKRFPREPFPQFYTPTQHTLHVCGKPTYHVDPWNMKCLYSEFGPHDFHWWPEYHGFGLKPGHFVPCDPCYGSAPLPSNCCGVGCKSPFDCPAPHAHEDFRFLAPSQVGEKENQILVYFPAQDLLLCGDYKLIIVLVVYESGWGRNNLHTYTIDKGIVFSLVDDETGASGDLIIDVDKGIILSTDVRLITSNEPIYSLKYGQQLNIGDADLSGNSYKIYGIIGQLTIPFEYGWEYDDLIFTSSNPNIVDVDPLTGTLTAKNISDAQNVIITVRNSKNSNINYKFMVSVGEAPFELYVGFSTDGNSPQNAINANNWSEIAASETDGVVVNCQEDDVHMWVKSTVLLHPIDADYLYNTNGVTSNDIKVPMKPATKIGNYYYYGSSNSFRAGNIELTFKF